MSESKEAKYIEAYSKATGLMDPKCGEIANMANMAALLKETFGFWWCGFYIVNKDNVLELGPFQGPVACTLIPFGKGVCGTSWAKGESIVVPDVHQFEGHIACSSISNSEIVVPMRRNGQIIGVLDIDSEQFNHFDDVDRIYLEKMVSLL